jgi:hypothetical protein
MSFSTIRLRAARFFPSPGSRPAHNQAFDRHAPCCNPALMRVLEARFYPRRRGQPDFVMVGYLVWRDERQRERPVFEPARATIAEAVFSKLRYLVDMTEPGSFERLQSLRSEFWSFVPIRSDERQTAKLDDVS